MDQVSFWDYVLEHSNCRREEPSLPHLCHSMGLYVEMILPRVCLLSMNQLHPHRLHLAAPQIHKILLNCSYQHPTMRLYSMLPLDLNQQHQFNANKFWRYSSVRQNLSRNEAYQQILNRLMPLRFYHRQDVDKVSFMEITFRIQQDLVLFFLPLRLLLVIAMTFELHYCLSKDYLFEFQQHFWHSMLMLLLHFLLLLLHYVSHAGCDLVFTYLHQQMYLSWGSYLPFKLILI